MKKSHSLRLIGEELPQGSLADVVVSTLSREKFDPIAKRYYLSVEDRNAMLLLAAYDQQVQNQNRKK